PETCPTGRNGLAKNVVAVKQQGRKNAKRRIQPISPVQGQRWRSTAGGGDARTPRIWPLATLSRLITGRDFRTRISGSAAWIRTTVNSSETASLSSRSGWMSLRDAKARRYTACLEIGIQMKLRGARSVIRQ